MALVQETGAGLANAQTYATVEYYREFCKRRGIAVPASALDCESQLTKAWDAMLGADYKARRATRDQAGDFPRIGLKIDDFFYRSDEIPSYVPDAQCALAIISRTTDLLPTIVANASGGMIERTLGPLTTRWSDSGRASTRPIIESARVFLNKLLRSSGNNIRLSRG